MTISYIQSLQDKEIKERFHYRAHFAPIRTYDGIMQAQPCIVLVDSLTGIIVDPTGYETYLYKLNKSELLSPQKLRKMAYLVCQFLNFLLHKTNKNRLDEIDIDDLQRFLLDYRTKTDGTEKAAKSFNDMIAAVFSFLSNYIEAHPHKEFKISIADLYTEKKIGGKMVRRFNRLGVKEPKRGKKTEKNRIILYGYEKILLMEARKHDPMLELPIQLQLYAGLREGEIVNIEREGIEISRSLGRFMKIRIDLSHPASFWKQETYLSTHGEIKKYRKQEIFYDFLDDVAACYDRHMKMLDLYMEEHGLPYDAHGPILYNENGNPMTVQTYSTRLKRLFYDHFLPTLKQYCLDMGIYEENEPFISSYEKEYPGAHSMRHWFTMYLLTRAEVAGESLKTAEIANWRGDKNELSMQNYIHENRAMIEAFTEAIFTFQEDMWRTISEYKQDA